MELLTAMQTYIMDNIQTYRMQMLSHIGICLLCLAVCCMTAIPLGYLCVRHEKYQNRIVAVVQILRIIPSLAVLILLIPILGTGVKPAAAALILLAFPPVLMNAIDGFRDVSEITLENGYAMGMNPQEVFWKVHLPLAMPKIFIGIKIAAVELISSATLAAKIGAGGLGEIIFTGLGLNRTDMLLVGALSVALLAAAVSLLLHFAEKPFARGL